MGQQRVADGVTFERVKTPGELEACLGMLSDRERLDVASEFAERGQALHLDGQSQRVYSLRQEKDDIVIVTWGPMSTLLEAAILLSSVKTLAGPLDEVTAARLHVRASYRVQFMVEPKRHAPVAVTSPWSVPRLRAALTQAYSLLVLAHLDSVVVRLSEIGKALRAGRFDY